MISCIIRGDLGTQLFQIYATLAYCIKYKQPHLLYYNSKSSYPFFWDTLFRQLKDYIHDLAIDGAELFKRKLHVSIQEDSGGYSSLVVPMNIEKKNVLLEGYFYDKRYFEEEFREITEYLGIFKQQITIHKKFERLLFPYLGDYVYIAMYLQNGVGYTYYENELKTLIGNSGKHICLLLFYDIIGEYSLEDILTYLTANYSKYKIINANELLRDKNMDLWDKMLVMSVCNKVIAASGAYGWWAMEYNKYYNSQRK